MNVDAQSVSLLKQKSVFRGHNSSLSMLKLIHAEKAASHLCVPAFAQKAVASQTRALQHHAATR